MKIGFIGTGNMGTALAAAVAKSAPDTKLYFADFFKEKAEEVAKKLSGISSDNITLVNECDMVFFGVKPQVLPSVLSEIAPFVEKRAGKLTLVTMAAGVKIAAILSAVGKETPVIRIMPNTPVFVGEGVIVYCSENVSSKGEADFAALLSQGGLVEKIEEGKIDAASALHGCGPAFAYLFIEALADGAVSCGLSREAALRFAAKTAKGAAEMVLQTGKHPGELKDAVCSPGGSTIEGVRALEEGGFRGVTMDAVLASYKRTLELGK